VHAFAVADAVQRRHLVGGKAAGFREDGVDDVFTQSRKRAAGKRLAKPGDVLQGEGDLGDRRAIHAKILRASYTPTLDASSPASETRACVISF